MRGMRRRRRCEHAHEYRHQHTHARDTVAATPTVAQVVRPSEVAKLGAMLGNAVALRNSCRRDDSKTAVLTSAAMKQAARILLLIALLLPFRGAMAAGGLLCHSGSGSHPAVTQSMASEPVHDHRQVAAEHAHGHGHGESAHATMADSDAGPDAPSCNRCAAVCSAPPLPSPEFGLNAFPPSGAERFPATSSVCSTVALDGLERPPRTV